MSLIFKNYLLLISYYSVVFIYAYLLLKYLPDSVSVENMKIVQNQIILLIRLSDYIKMLSFFVVCLDCSFF